MPMQQTPRLTITFKDYLRQAGDLRTMARDGCGACWAAWKVGKTNDLNNPDNPFMGGPSVLLDRGITKVEGANGQDIEITTTTRIRMNMLSDAAMELLGVLRHKNGTNRDVVHPEYVDTAEINFANSEAYLQNNLAGVAAIIDAMATVLGDRQLQYVIDFIEEGLAGDTEVCQYFSNVARSSWIGRACTDGSWKSSSDFVFSFQLSTNASALDNYVAKPTLESLLAKLKAFVGVPEESSAPVAETAAA